MGVFQNKQNNKKAFITNKQLAILRSPFGHNTITVSSFQPFLSDFDFAIGTFAQVTFSGLIVKMSLKPRMFPTNNNRKKKRKKTSNSNLMRTILQACTPKCRRDPRPLRLCHALKSFLLPDSIAFSPNWYRFRVAGVFHSNKYL